ncbi:MAG: hypothetical protein JWN88_2896 [Frankiales bacterium]|nr:hypothetical protein [Frankiales bacterium]
MRTPPSSEGVPDALPEVIALATPPAMVARFRDLCIDSCDPAPVATFWGAVLGREVELDPDGAYLRAGADGGPSIYVNRVPEPKSGKVRLHIDVTLEPGQQIADLLALGAVLVREPGDVPWWVLADPEDNEFCAFLPGADASNDADAEVPA